MRNLLHTCSSYIAMLLLSALVAVACTPSVPSDVIQPDEMEDILYDYYISQAMAGQALNQKDASYDRYVYFSAVLQKHGVTEAEFDSSLVYYYSNAKRLHGIYSSLSERIGNEAMGLGASVNEFNKYSSLSESGDTANIWQDATSLLLTPYAPSNKFTFSIKADSTYKVGDSFLVNFMSDFIYQAGTKDAVVYVAVRYDNDSVSTHVTHIGVSGVIPIRSRVSLVDDHIHRPRHVRLSCQQIDVTDINVNCFFCTFGKDCKSIGTACFDYRNICDIFAVGYRAVVCSPHKIHSRVLRVVVQLSADDINRIPLKHNAVADGKMHGNRFVSLGHLLVDGKGRVCVYPFAECGIHF